MKIVECWIEHPVRSLDRPYTYLTEEDIEQGARVRVPFGNKELTGFVESVKETNETAAEIESRLGMKLKKILSVLDKESLITDELHDLALWMKEETISTAISCFQAMLPSKIKPNGTKKSVVKLKYVTVSDQEVSLTPKQLLAYSYVKEHQPLTYRELRAQFPNQARALIEKKALLIEEKEQESTGVMLDEKQSAFPLTPAQKQAYDEIQNTDDPVYLLHGVTGSGKTEIYLHLAEDALRHGLQALFLVPEIGLTPQMIQRVSARFGSDLAIYHSGLNDQEKYEQYRMVKTGRARIVVGTRSAVFLPFDHLGLIVMDEEHDTSYKQENQPAYHCRDVAIWRGKYHSCKVVLGSATPTLDSYARAIKHVYHLVKLDQRISGALPLVKVVSMKDNLRKGGSLILSNELKAEMRDRFEKGEQVILLLNRRGYNTQLRCKDCGEVIKCPHCDLAMSYHREGNVLKCHTCGTEMKVPKICPYCGSAAGFMTYGFGTERLEQEVCDTFENIRVLRMDADTTVHKNSHEKLLKAFGNHEADVLLGTQMIAKGLDYPDVTLVGIINGDRGLERSDFRSCEMTFDLLMQAVGRCGRADKKGTALIQVFDPNHYAIQYAAKQDYESFFRKEMQFRHAGQYPPYTYFIAVTVVAKDQKHADHKALELKNRLNGNFKTIGIISLLKIKDQARDRIILKGKSLDEMRAALRKALDPKEMDVSGIRIDVNPMTLG